MEPLHLDTVLGEIFKDCMVKRRKDWAEKKKKDKEKYVQDKDKILL